MQTFLISDNPAETAKILDNRRLGKQRVEAIQIANILIGETSKKGWRNHPAVKMWRGYESYLVKVYLRAMMREWLLRGYSNEKCFDHFQRLLLLVKDIEPKQPHWFNEEFFQSHKSNLVRKCPEHYKSIFNVDENLPYIWPNGN